jgi:hypothetical protein
MVIFPIKISIECKEKLGTDPLEQKERGGVPYRHKSGKCVSWPLFSGKFAGVGDPAVKSVFPLPKL